MRFEFFGQVTVTAGPRRVGAHGEQPALVVARLVLDRPTPLPREELADLLWPANRPDRWEGPARHVISRARALLVEAGAPAESIESRSGRVEFELDEVIEVDVEEALRATADAEAAVEGEDWAQAAQQSHVALELLRRPFFERSQASWTRRWHERLRAYLLRALHAGAVAALGDDRPADAVLLASESLASDPFDERATRALMRAHDALGSRGNALAAYEACRRHLQDELGVRPSDETEALYAELAGSGATAARDAGEQGTRAIDAQGALPFVGRQAELDQLVADLQSARRGPARAVIIEGEPGIGKTRLARELVQRATDEGTVVAWGACSAEIGLAHQPFGDLLTDVFTQRPAIIDQLGTLVHDLAALVPDVVARSPSGPVDEFARERVFRAVAAAFGALDEPVVIVVDDLQWSGPDGMAMLRHLLPSIESKPALLVITVRDAVGAVAATLAEVQERLPTTHVPLSGLNVEDLAEVLERAGVHLTDDLRTVAAEVEARTTGNPFYVSQLVGDASAGRPFDPGAVPDALAQLVGRRLDALDTKLSSTIALAAVAGNEFTFETIEACSPLSVDRLMEILEQFCRMRFLEELEPGRFRFVHALARDAVLGTIGRTRRQQLHRRVAAVLADQKADAAVLAHHYVAAGSVHAHDATLWSLAAGREALDQGAWSVAHDHFLAAAGHASEVDHRGAALVGLGLAQRALGDTQTSRATLEEALMLARAHGRGRVGAAATLALVGGGGRGVAVDAPGPERAARLRAALAELDDDDLLVPLLGELALSLVLTEAEQERREIAERCVTEARRRNEPDGIAMSLQTLRSARMGPSGTLERAANAREVLSFPAEALTRERVIAAHLALVEDLLELGDRDGASEALVAGAKAAERLAHPYWSWAATGWRALNAIIDGDFERAEALAYEAFAFQAPARHPEATAALGVNICCIRLYQGRGEETLEQLREAADANPHIPCYRAVLALEAGDCGRLDIAEEAVSELAANGFVLPPDSNWLLGITSVADAVATLGVAEHARILLGMLEPFADRHVVLNAFGAGGAYGGPVSYTLGRLALALGENDRALTWLDQAAAAARDFRTPLFGPRIAAARAAALIDPA